ncbi:MAG TPA: HAD family hydrolase [Bryobacteraceae bacterium]|nr:HAD family hydrolase [Bryobacteraceae bacterium]
MGWVAGPEIGTPKYICWDFDGTLAYRNGTWSRCLMDVLRTARPDCAVAVEALYPHLGAGFPWHQPEAEHTDITDAEGWWRRVTPVFVNAFRAVLRCSEEEAIALSSLVRPAYLDAGAWKVYDDTFQCLEELRSQGCRHVILSNHVPELPQIVDCLGLTPYIDRIFNSAETGYEKPHPRAFQNVIESLRPCSSIWMVGDNPVADIEGARAVGMKALLVRAAGKSLREVRRLVAAGDGFHAGLRTLHDQDERNHAEEDVGQ